MPLLGSLTWLVKAACAALYRKLRHEKKGCAERKYLLRAVWQSMKPMERAYRMLTLGAAWGSHSHDLESCVRAQCIMFTLH